MSFRGHVAEGVVVFDDNVQLPEGTPVNVEPISVVTTEPAGAEIPTLYERLKPFIGAVTGLPPDFAENHDHYLHGAAK